MLIRPRREVLTTGGVVVSVVALLAGIGMLWLVGAMVVQTVQDGTGLFDMVGIARPTPLWMAIVALCLLSYAGVAFIVDSAGYLVRAVRGELPRPAGDLRARREHAARKASRHQRQVWARSAEARRRRAAE
ncbi:hypothetical protein JNB62_17865 [Microbacterium jejuense]|uniref:Uncharacterized protein n=1 Tax=Microbacterium jejuense TaxID=1263637 RepID=A0ABS7HSY8_9MICO|nr:hypothetical protein [Microbacterium jejuense]MBW9095549.1 hypothetical protein [Microbacterium jejuense]